MSLAIVTYMVLRIPCVKYFPEKFTIGEGFPTIDKIERRLKKDKNIIKFYRV